MVDKSYVNGTIRKFVQVLIKSTNFKEVDTFLVFKLRNISFIFLALASFQIYLCIVLVLHDQ